MENQLATEGRERSSKMVGACLEGLVHVITYASHRGEEAVKQCLLALSMLPLDACRIELNDAKWKDGMGGGWDNGL